MRKRWMAGVALLPLLAGCEKKESGTFLGSAVVEAETYQVSALVQGPLLAVSKDEGDTVRTGELLALVDTLPYALQYAEAEANLEELHSGTSTQSSQIASQGADVGGLDKEARRQQALLKSGTTTPQQLDKAVAARDAARYRLEAAKQSLQGLGSKQEALRARLDLLANQLGRCRVLSPVDGIVLTRYRNAGEAVAPGQSVYEIGRGDSVHADFFVSQKDLALLKLGDTVRIRVESPGGARHVPAVIRFLASEAEFTPKNVQTRESRAELVFRVRASAATADGLLKRGLPVEIWR